MKWDLAIGIYILYLNNGTDKSYFNNDLIIKVVQLVDIDHMAYQLDASILKIFLQ